MAWRMKVRLPSLKVTQRSASSSATNIIVPRGRRDEVRVATSMEEAANEPSSGGYEFEGNAADGILDGHPDHDFLREPSPSLHEINEAANSLSWKSIRSDLLRAITESFAMPMEKKCCLCCESAACRCVQCGAAIYYCRKCFEESHVASVFTTRLKSGM